MDDDVTAVSLNLNVYYPMLILTPAGGLYKNNQENILCEILQHLSNHI
jgi:hypothetical protein